MENDASRQGGTRLLREVGTIRTVVYRVRFSAKHATAILDGLESRKENERRVWRLSF